MKTVGHDPRADTGQHQLLAYVADLELEVDRLRKLTQFVQCETRRSVEEIHQACVKAEGKSDGAPQIVEIAAVVRELAAVLKDGYEPTGYHPAHDQVVAIALRPLIEQIFRWQQRLLSAPEATLHLELTIEHVDWFPARLRHILDNLISNALRFRDPSKGEARVSLTVARTSDGYALRVSDNGLGMSWNKRAEAFELYHRAGPARATGLGVGIAVVKLLLEQSGGKLKVESGEGQGTSFLAILPYYTAQDYLDSSATISLH
jgi:signal transduction histidine kinase